MSVGQVSRPLMHFTPERNWMNDPNGLVFHDGRYHLFFQYNPEGAFHGNMSWGHATSTDLVRWQEHPVAIACDEEEEIFSGSAVFDEDNTSGFGTTENPPLVAVYTSAYRNETRQAQSLAYSIDGGVTWTKYSGNPVLDRRSADFRDPKVFRYERSDDAYWVMVAVEAADRQVVLYRSDDLKRWSFLSAYGPAGAVGGVWECPDLFPLAVDGDPSRMRWVLLISLNPGGLAGGSGTQYVLGDFDGTTFVADEQYAPIADGAGLSRLRWVDFGRDCYAGVTFNGLPHAERISLAWMSNWDYAHAVPTAPWRGAMTLPRRLSLRAIDDATELCAEPIVSEGRVTEDRRGVVLTGGAVFEARVPDVARLDLSASGDGSESCSVVLSGDEGSVTVRCDLRGGRVEVDRHDATPPGMTGFASTERMPVGVRAGRLDLSIVIDSSSLEVFTSDGSRWLTDLVFLGSGRTVRVDAETGAPRIDAIRVTDLS